MSKSQEFTEVALFLLPLLWVCAGTLIYIASTVVGGLTAVALQAAGVIALAGVGSTIFYLCSGHQLPHATWQSRPTSRLGLLMLLPWAYAMSHQIVPYWNDAAHYVNSSFLLFTSQVGLRDVTLFAESELRVQGDFHGPAYLFLHWPMAVGQIFGLSRMTSSSVAYVGIIALKVVTLYIVMRASQYVLGGPSAALFMGALLLFPYTRYIYAGTHREWFLIYGVALLGWSVTRRNRLAKTGLLLAGCLFAQSHILSLVALVPTLYLFRPWRPFDSDAVQRFVALSAGLTIGYSPLLIRVLSGQIAGSASLDSLASVAPEMLENFDQSRNVFLQLPLVGEIAVPPIGTLALAVLICGMGAGLHELYANRSEFQRRLAAAGLQYQALMFAGLLGAFDGIIGLLGFEMGWLSLQKLLGANSRYWMLAVLISAFQLIKWVKELQLPLVNFDFAKQSRVYFWHIYSAGCVVIAVALASRVFVMFVYESQNSWFRDQFFQGSQNTPVSSYLGRLSEFSRPVFFVGVGAITLLTYSIGFVTRKVRGSAELDDHQAARNIPIQTRAVLVLAVVASAVATTPLDGYGHGRTEDVFAEREYWTTTLQNISWEQSCFVAASSSTVVFFLDSPNLPVVYLQAAELHDLWLTDSSVLRRPEAETLPCGVFPDGMADQAPRSTNWRRIFTSRIDGPGGRLYIDPLRTSIGEVGVELGEVGVEQG